MRVLDVDHAPLLDALSLALGTESDPVRRQVAIELLTVRHAIGMQQRRDALLVADSMHKHIRQIIGQYFDAYVDTDVRTDK